MITNQDAMNKIAVFLLLLTIGFLSCKNSEKEIDKLGIAKEYYEILDKSNSSGIETILTDSLLTKETEYEYEQTFSIKEYLEWIAEELITKDIFTSF